MANTIAVLLPLAAEFPASAFAQLTLVNRRPVLAFDAATDEACQWTLAAHQALGSTLTLAVKYFMASGNTGTIDFEVDVEAITDGDAQVLTADSFDALNGITAEAVPGTAGYMGEFIVTLTNKDSIAAADYVRIRLRRDADDVTNDTTAGDCYVVSAELRDA